MYSFEIDSTRLKTSANHEQWTGKPKVGIQVFKVKYTNFSWPNIKIKVFEIYKIIYPKENQIKCLVEFSFNFFNNFYFILKAGQEKLVNYLQ